jgi:hypothetical protein
MAEILIMKIYLTSNVPVSAFDPASIIGLNASKNPPADFLIEDIIDIFRYEGSSAVNTEEIALSKKRENKAKYIYSVEIKKIE